MDSCSLRTRIVLLASVAAFVSEPAVARRAPVRRPPIQRQLDDALAQLARQRAQIDAQAVALAELRRRFDERNVEVASVATPPTGPAPVISGGLPGTVGDTPQAVPIERVGAAPEDADRPIELAVLDGQGSVVTRRGQLTAELQTDYARADRSRAVFRGVELVEAVLVGVFDINESRQDVITASASVRYGLTDRLEIGVRVPYVYRADTSIIAPIAGSTNNDEAATIDNSVRGNGIGDIEATIRYQLLDGHGGSPFLIANLQAVAPTGTNPFAIPRDDLGRATRAATGAGFWGLTPSITAVLPSDPVVLFGTLGYTVNFAKATNTRIPPVIIDYVNPGNAISASAGIGISFNERTTLNLGYAHSWVLGTTTRTSLIDPTPQWPGMRTTKSRDLQIGRLLFGVTYRVTDRASLNWSVEVGATEDATDLRTSLRLPIVLLSGR